MRKLHTCMSGLVIVTALALLPACGGGGGGSGTPNSTLNLGLTDSPITGAQKVWISFTGVEVKPVNGNPIDFTFSPSVGFDLLTLQNGATATFLNGKTVPAGQYEWVRLMVDTTAGSSYVIDSLGNQHDLIIPSGAETGLKLIQGFTMPVGGVADFTVDFVLSRSILAPAGQLPSYVLKPVLRLVDNSQVGTIAGTFQANTLQAQPNCTAPSTVAPVVYIYPGAGVTPDDIYNPISPATDTAVGTESEVEPLVTATAALNSSSQYAFKVAFLTAGTYTVTFTCDNDDPNVDESASTPSTVRFATTQTVTVTNGRTTQVTF